MGLAGEVEARSQGAGIRSVELEVGAGLFLFLIGLLVYTQSGTVPAQLTFWGLVFGPPLILFLPFWVRHLLARRLGGADGTAATVTVAPSGATAGGRMAMVLVPAIVIGGVVLPYYGYPPSVTPLLLAGFPLAAAVSFGWRGLYLASAATAACAAVSWQAALPLVETVALAWAVMGAGVLADGAWIARRVTAQAADDAEEGEDLPVTAETEPAQDGVPEVAPSLATDDAIALIVNSLESIPVLAEDLPAPEYRAILTLNRLIHEPARLAIMALLSCNRSNGRVADFKYLSTATNLTDGNLNAHLAKLQAAGLVVARKAMRGKVAYTTYALTDEGAAVFEEYWETLGTVAYQVEMTRRQAELPFGDEDGLDGTLG